MLIYKNKGFIRYKINKHRNNIKKIIMMKKIKYSFKKDSNSYKIIHKKGKVLVIVISNKYFLS